MQDFIEKWKNEPKFKTKIQLGLYTLFVVVVAVFAVSTRGNEPIDTPIFEKEEKESEDKIEDNFSIEIPQEYNYTKNITINTEEYQYTGHKNDEQETINKISIDETIEYLYKNDNYYKNEDDTYILTTKEEIYNEINPNYLKLETINQYLTKAKLENNSYIVYLKDIILANDSEEFIKITIENNKTSIDYTSLMKLFDETINNYLVEVIIEEIEREGE